MSSTEVVIVSAKRTPIGAFLGALAPAHRGAARQRRRQRPPSSPPASARRDPGSHHGVCACRPASARRRRARRRSAAGVPVSVPATTVNKMCGSALKAVMMAAEQIRAGSARGHARRRTRIDVQRPLPAAEGTQRLPHGSRARCSITCSTTDCRAPSTASHGLLRGRDRGQVPVQPRPAGRFRHRVRAARHAGARRPASSTPKSRRSR